MPCSPCSPVSWVPEEQEQAGRVLPLAEHELRPVVARHKREEDDEARHVVLPAAPAKGAANGPGVSPSSASGGVPQQRQRGCPTAAPAGESRNNAKSHGNNAEGGQCGST